MVVLVILVGLSILLSRLMTGKNNMWLSVGIDLLPDLLPENSASLN